MRGGELKLVKNRFSKEKSLIHAKFDAIVFNYPPEATLRPANDPKGNDVATMDLAYTEEDLPKNSFKIIQHALLANSTLVLNSRK